jgi:uncharacterized repeat protein (TIGR01451 family)
VTPHHAHEPRLPQESQGLPYTPTLRRSIVTLRLLGCIIWFLTGASSVAQTAIPTFTDPPGYPTAWPDGLWRPYTYKATNISDLNGGSGGDKSTGGTNPSGYVDNVADADGVSSYYYGTSSMLYFRYVLNGPPLALSGASQPLASATWTVLMDTDGDGYKNFAVMLSGIDSNGAGNLAPDDIIVMYNTRKSQALDPATDTLWRQDSARHITPSERTNADGEPGDASTWDSNPDPYVWNFSRTRVVQINTTLAPGSNNSKYYLDIQVPIAALDASSRGGPKISSSTPMSFGFTTANSNTNPAQKDFGFQGDYLSSDVTEPLPFADVVDPDDGTIQRPVITEVAASTCSANVTLTARVLDALELWGNSQLRTSVRQVQFYSYFDANGNGVADDTATWTSIATVTMNATPSSTTFTGGTVTDNRNPWLASWNATTMTRGTYLIKAVATDDQTNTTDSTDTSSVSTTYNPATEQNSGPVVGRFANTCGTPPASISKLASESTVTAGGTVDFTLTVTNTGGSDITLSNITDPLPSGFTYHSHQGGTLAAASSSPAAGATGTLTWTFPPGTSIPAGQDRTLIFRVTVATTAGTYANTATAVTNIGSLVLQLHMMAGPSVVGTPCSCLMPSPPERPGENR